MKPNLIKNAHYTEKSATTRGAADGTWTTFTSGIMHKAKSVLYFTEPVKDTGGEPAHPVNVQPTNSMTAYINSETYTTSWLPNANAINIDGEDLYGGSIDMATGTLTVTHTKFKLKVSDMNSQMFNYPSVGRTRAGWRFDNGEIRSIVGDEVDTYFDGYTNIGGGFYLQTSFNDPGLGKVDYIWLDSSEYYDMTKAEWMSRFPNLTVEVILKYGTPRVYNLTPMSIFINEGENRIYKNYEYADIIYFDSVVSTERMGVLTDIMKCVVTEELNGGFELELTYPVEGIHAEELGLDSIIEAKPNDISDPQLFRIYKANKPINGRVTYNAEHISYRLMHIPCLPFYAQDVRSALIGLKTNALEDCPFTFWTDKDTVADYIQIEPASIRSRLGGVEGSILDTYHGEYEWDNYTVRLYQHRGSDRGVTLRYGKNITDLSVDASLENTITGVCPYWKDDEAGVIVMLPENTVYSANADAYPFKRTIALDVSSEFDMEPTEEELRAYAQRYLARSGVTEPDTNIKVSFVALWDTPEYASIAPLEKVALGDTVHVYYEKLGVSGESKVVKTKYNSLTERYESIELGSVKSNLNKTISEVVAQETSDDVTPSDLQKALDEASAKILGSSKGYKVEIRDAAGYIKETRYVASLEDFDDPSAAETYWVWNYEGLGFFRDGDRTVTAIDNEGNIVADAITSGTINAGLVKAGILSNSPTPTAGDNYWNLNTGELNVTFGSVRDADGNGIAEAIQNGVNEANAYADAQDDSVKSRISESEETLAKANGMISSLNQNVASITQRIYTDDDGLHIAAARNEDSKASIVVVNNRISFRWDGNEVGYINQDGFNLANGVLTNSLTVGRRWVWVEDNYHLRLLYNG